MMRTYRPTRIIWMSLIGICAVGAALQLTLNWHKILDAKPPEFSPKNMLQALWHTYKASYLETGTYRSLDKQQSDITTSEGQSYSMLRSVWLDDKDAFDKSWQWTKDNLQHKDDHLIAWLFGKRADGRYGILTDRGGNNSASDADVDIALSLLFAARRWNDNSYFGDAIVIVRAIWEREVIEVKGKPYLAANNVEKTVSKQAFVVNPSYLAPYAYKIFAKADPDHDWLGLASTSYDVAKESLRQPLDKQSSAFLPPDWIVVDRSTGAVSAVPQPTSLTSNFSYDALRLPWRFALDWTWNKDPRAKEVLDTIGFLSDEWRSHGSIQSAYAHDGAPLSSEEAPAMYGGAIGYFIAEDPATAKSIYLSKLESLYDPNTSKWKESQSYYDENWAWFGMALYQGELPNLYNDEP